VQTVYAQGDEATTSTPTVSSNATNQEAADTSPIRQADTRTTIISLVISFGIVFEIFIFVNYSLKGSKMKLAILLEMEVGFLVLQGFNSYYGHL
jgi:hypothetical protein